MKLNVLIALIFLWIRLLRADLRPSASLLISIGYKDIKASPEQSKERNGDLPSGSHDEQTLIPAAQASAGGRIIGYMAGWKTPPPVSDLVDAGYTHILVAFGVFSTIHPGQVISGFHSISPAYVASLKAAGLKVLMSIGGALSYDHDATVSFKQIRVAVGNDATFSATFVASVEQLMVQYGFDGIDIDIQVGLGVSGTFNAPTGDIGVLVGILRTLHDSSPGMLITLAPQAANISPTSGFSEAWGNYASLIGQTYDILEWVGIQLYNTGCMHGLDHVCYPNIGGDDQTFSVVMATDLLEDWPALLPNGVQPSGFQPYISRLEPHQIVLGYPSPNAQGVSDGAPVTNLAAIKNAIRCLSTGSDGCSAAYSPPRAYGPIGGVFNWEISYDQNNGYAFATGLKQCVINGDCGGAGSTVVPSGLPTASPKETPTPSRAPSCRPSRSPTRIPTSAPMGVVTRVPTATLSQVPSRAPTRGPTRTPSQAPTRVPTISPSHVPTRAPSRTPTLAPTRVPTSAVSVMPTRVPTRAPSSASPLRAPTATRAPTRNPTRTPSRTPTNQAPAAVPTSADGRIIGYMAGWKTPPPVSELVEAGYTHILVAFGVFSTIHPGQITAAFATVTAPYIASLQAAGMKVLLSLGGASSSIPGTTVNFNQVRVAAGNDATFSAAFVASVEQLMAQYGFDGVDIDIEIGLGVGGTFNAPTGDIGVLAGILRTLYDNNPGILITLTPQTANVAANGGFDATWGNYASLIGQTYDILEWVGIQLYNTGCMFGIDGVCYSNNGGNDQTFSVVMATDLLEDWPATLPGGQASGFQPYISRLEPHQIVLGYPSPNAQGASDGAPATSVAAIKNAIQCLSTGSDGCSAAYSPPRAYGPIGGVFNWEISYDQNNGYAFATGLRQCVVNGICT